MKNLVFTLATLLLVSSLSAQDGGFHLDKSYKIASNGLVDLRSSDAKVFITGSARPDAHVKIDRKVTSKGWTFNEGNFRVDVEADNGNLSIHERSGRSQISVVGYYHEEYRIEIDVPEGMSLTVKGDDGDYSIKNINGSIRLNLDDADAELVGCNGSDFEFNMDDGDIRMKGGKGKLTISGDDADLEISGGHFSYIHARLDDGDLAIETSLDDKGDYFIETEDGTVVINITQGGGEFDIRHDDTHVITEGSFKVLEKGDQITRATLPNGVAKIEIRADDAKVKLRSN